MTPRELTCRTCGLAALYLLLACLPLMMAGCQSGSAETAEHHGTEHKPADFPTAVTRLRQLHAEILGGPLVAREVHASHHHHDHSHGHDHSHVRLDALQELSDIVRWLPALAADSDLQEDAWNRTNTTSQDLTAIVARLTDPDAGKRRSGYQSQSSLVESHLVTLEEIAQQFDVQPNHLTHDHK